MAAANAHFLIFKQHENVPVEQAGLPAHWTQIAQVTSRAVGDEAEVVRESASDNGRYRAVRFDLGADYEVAPPAPKKVDTAK